MIKKMKYKKVKNSSKNKDLYEIESVESPPKSTNVNIPVFSYDRPGISGLNRSRNVLRTSGNCKSSVSVTKNDFIKKWLMTTEIERNNNLSASCLSSIDNNPPIVKRLPLSPLREPSDLKRRRLSIEAKISPKKGEIQKENYDQSVLNQRSRTLACRLMIFGVNPRVKNAKIGENSSELIEENGVGRLKQMQSVKSVISQCESVTTKNLEIDSASSTQSEVIPKIMDDNSINSSQKGPEIESQSSEDDGESIVIDNADDNKSNLEDSIDQLIEDPEGDSQEVQDHSDRRVERILSFDSDRTYFSEGSPVDQRIEECVSQKISNITMTSQDTILRRISTFSDNGISVEASTLSRKTDGETYPSINRKTGKKSRKAKKGSMLEEVQMLINKQISSLRIWRHQMGQARFKGTCNTYVMVKILKFSMIYGRPVFEGVVIKDNSNLIDKSINNSSDLSADVSNNSLNRNVTVLTIPEIVGQVSVKDKNTLKLYPPLAIIDPDKLILSVLKFDLISDDSGNSQIGRESMDKSVIIKEFNCCCLKNGRILNSCCEKFSNSKPTAIDFIFQ